VSGQHHLTQKHRLAQHRAAHTAHLSVFSSALISPDCHLLTVRLNVLFLQGHSTSRYPQLSVRHFEQLLRFLCTELSHSPCSIRNLGCIFSFPSSSQSTLPDLEDHHLVPVSAAVNGHKPLLHNERKAAERLK